MKKRNTDTIPAMLSPHEAVLNRKAADLLGRDNIKKLNARGNAMESYQRGTSDVGRDDRADLLRDTENTFYGGGHAVPSPTPTPVPRKYQYGTNNVRAMDYTASPPAITSGAQGFGGAPTASMGAGSGNTSFNSIPTSGSGGFSTGSSPINGSINATAGSRSVNPFGGIGIPDLSKADPGTLSRLQGGMEGLIYNPAGGGYKFDQYRSTPGTQVLSPYYKGNYADIGSDPNANRAASAYYNYIGGLPTRPLGTPALNQLYGMTGQSPTPGPSYNSILSQYADNPLAKQAGFGPTYKGPYGFGG